jgi:hypothetical protein
MSLPTSVPQLLLHHAVENPHKVAFSGPGWAIVRPKLDFYSPG